MEEKKNLLVIDNDPAMRRRYVAELGGAGYRLSFASNGLEGFAKVGAENPDLVILDAQLPGMDGLQTLALILEQNRSVPVIMNSRDPCYKDRFMSWAADACLVKSSDLTELRKTIQSLLSRQASSLQVI